jgi:hypothetical protein
LIRAHNAGCGAVVTKTIRIGRAINPVRHIAAFGHSSLVNCEKWSDLERDQWYEHEIPLTKAAGAVVIASVGHTPEEARVIVPDAEKAGADMNELVCYSEDAMLSMLEIAKNSVSIPVICKLSANGRTRSKPPGMHRARRGRHLRHRLYRARSAHRRGKRAPGALRCGRPWLDERRVASPAEPACQRRH